MCISGTTDLYIVVVNAYRAQLPFISTLTQLILSQMLIQGG